MSRIAIWLATAGGAGYAPVAPGTFGSAVGVIVYLLTRHLSTPVQGALLLVIVVAGIWACSEAARVFQRDDPGAAVIDEVAGQLVTYFLLDLSWVGITLGFFLFRALDIVKPWPARQLEDLHGGLGIMADDLMAGVYGWIILALVVTYVPMLR